VDRLNPIPMGSAINFELTHGTEVFEAGGKVVYCCAGQGMGIPFDQPLLADESAILCRWIAELTANQPA
jgi:hypothetical protein